MSLFIGDLAISSADISNLERIADEFTADGGHKVPRLEVSGIPEGAVELAVICHDPDAPLPQGFTHWTVYGLGAETGPVDLQSDTVRIGPNGAGAPAWYGPEPPVGHGTHHYYFWVYALKRHVEGTPTREEFLAEYAGDIVEQARLVGLYSR